MILNNNVQMYVIVSMGRIFVLTKPEVFFFCDVFFAEKISVIRNFKLSKTKATNYFMNNHLCILSKQCF